MVTMEGIVELRTTESTGCRAETLWDPPGPVEREAADEVFPALSVLEGGDFLLEPGHGNDYEGPFSKFEDMNFDGYKDLCLMGQFRGFTSGIPGLFRCWVYSPEERRFLFKKSMGNLAWGAKPDPVARTFSVRTRGGGFSWSITTYAWENQEVVALKQVDFNRTRFTEDGGVPREHQAPGNMYWETLHERRGGKLVQIRERLVHAE